MNPPGMLHVSGLQERIEHITEPLKVFVRERDHFVVGDNPHFDTRADARSQLCLAFGAVYIEHCLFDALAPVLTCTNEAQDGVAHSTTDCVIPDPAIWCRLSRVRNPKNMSARVIYASDNYFHPEIEILYSLI